MTRQEKARYILTHPVVLGKLLGYKDLTELHDYWMRKMLTNPEDMTLQAHRGSFKTTCLCIVIALLMITQRSKNIIFLRKTDMDVQEVIKNVRRILESDIMQQCFYVLTGTNLTLNKSTASELTSNAFCAPVGAAQLLGIGINGSLTGKHADIVITDDIVNRKDRKSKADRETTKAVYQELQNIKNRGGRIINTGTPWHKDDAFTLMPNIERYDCYQTGLISEDELEQLRKSMSSSLFAANYELRHIAQEDLLFANPKYCDDAAAVEQGVAHLDASYGGEDGTAFTIMKKVTSQRKVHHEATEDAPEWDETVPEVRYYVFGKLWQRHVDDCIDEAIRLRRAFNAGKIYNENNGDKGYLGKDLKRRGERTVVYHEDMNKYEKIATYLKAIWEDLYFVPGTDKEYIEQICDYSEDADHDDAPDSCACLARLLWKKNTGGSTYTPLYN